VNEAIRNTLAEYGQLDTNQSYISLSLYKENFLKVQIYYESLSTTFVREQAAISQFEFVSELGTCTL